MRKKCLGLAAVLLSLQITGCGAINLTMQEKNVIAEYIANILLKHDKNYEPTLQYDFEEEQEEAAEKPVQEEPEKEEAEPKRDPESESSGKQGKKEDQKESYLEVSSVYGNGIRVSPAGYSFYQEYPKKTAAILPVEASAGNTICVVKLNLKNTTSGKKKIDFLSENYTYQLEINSKKIYKALQSFLVDDIQYLDVTLKPGKSCEAVVMFEIPKKMKKKSLQMLITKGSKTAAMMLS